MQKYTRKHVCEALKYWKKQLRDLQEAQGKIIDAVEGSTEETQIDGDYTIDELRDSITGNVVLIIPDRSIDSFTVIAADSLQKLKSYYLDD